MLMVLQSADMLATVATLALPWAGRVPRLASAVAAVATPTPLGLVTATTGGTLELALAPTLAETLLLVSSFLWFVCVQNVHRRCSARGCHLLYPQQQQQQSKQTDAAATHWDAFGCQMHPNATSLWLLCRELRLLLV